MGPVKELVIELTKHSFEPGDVLRGRVRVHLEDAVKLRSIKVYMFGDAKVHWRTRGRYPTHYTAEENYMNHAISLWGTADSQMHPPGLHYYPFEFQLPANIPSSFEGERRYLGILTGTVPIGSIRYWCKVVMDVPFFPDHETCCPVPVMKMVSLNCFPQLLVPGKRDYDASVSCCCARGAITASLTINKQAFVPGENIIINAEIENSSNAKMTTRVYLKQYAHHYGYSNDLLGSDELVPTMSTSVVSQMVHPTFRRRQTDQWVNERLLIPPTEQTMMNECQIITIFHVLEMHVHVNWGSGPTLKIPIIIGAIPFGNVETASIPDDTSVIMIETFRTLAQQSQAAKRSVSVPRPTVSVLQPVSSSSNRYTRFQ